MARQAVIKELAKILGRENVLFSKRDLLAYSYDATQRQEMPDIVVLPRTAAEVSKIMKVAYREKIPVIPRGAGTGISGGTVPVKGSIVMELSRMNDITALDPANRLAIAEPGVINLDLQDALAPLGFMYPPDPASQKSCTLGGNIGENAGGPLCFRYGVTSKYVSGMEVVLPDGEVIDVGGSVEDTPGYDLRGLLIGSEGILCIATRLIVQIVPLPEASKTMLAIFDTLEDAGQSVSDIISAGIVPSALELMDKKMCGAIEQSLHAGYPTDAEGVLLIEIAGLIDSLDRQVKAISDVCRKNKVRELRIAKTSTERDGLWRGRKGAFGSIARLCPPYLVNDGTVPRNRLVQALLKVQEISARYHVQIANVAHAGDGNLHPLILYDCTIPEEVKAARKAGEEILDTCLALGGTISGEHGIGLEKLAAMTRMFSPADIATMRKVKQVFDPANILNPTKLLPPETDHGELNQEKVDPVAGNPDYTLYQRLVEIVGAENMKTGEEIGGFYRIDGILPEVVVMVSTTEQVSQVIRAGNQFHKTIVPWGSGSRQQSGPCLKSGDIILDLKHLNQVLDFDNGNSTIRIGAGKGNAELQREMAEYRLFFPLDSVFLETSTIGGELAAGDSGPRRLMYGNTRDLVLGLTMVTPTGDIIHAGGKTMKNVAGLDLCKMYVGSWGTLGVITEAVLRLFPLTEEKLSFCVVLPGVKNAFRLVNQIMNSVLTPCAMELIDSAAGRYLESSAIPRLNEGEILLLINVEGSNEVVERHLKEINSMAQANNASFNITLKDEKSEQLWKYYRRLHQLFLSQVSSGLKGRASIPLSKSSEMFQAVRMVGNRHSLEIGTRAHCGNGVFHLYIPAGKENSLKIIEDLKKSASSLGGFFILEMAPLEIRKSSDVWTRPGAYTLMQRLKSALDPNNVLNPGKI